MRRRAAVLVMVLLAVPSPALAQQPISEQAIAEAARSVVVEDAVAAAVDVDREAWQRPPWMDAVHFVCIGLLAGATVLDLHSTERAVLAGATEANPVYEPLVKDRDFRDFRVARLGVGAGLVGILTWLYLRAKHSTEAWLATGACGAATGVSLAAGGNNLRVAQQLEEAQ